MAKLQIGIIDLPNVGHDKTLSIPEVYVLASWYRVSRTRLQYNLYFK